LSRALHCCVASSAPRNGVAINGAVAKRSRVYAWRHFSCLLRAFGYRLGTVLGTGW
jgi:hypothetical protein